MSDVPQNPAQGQGHDDRAEPVPDGIPPALYARLVELRPSLTEQGIVQRRRCGTGTRWRVRVRVPHADHGRIHASIAIGGDEAVVAAVRQLIARWRQGRAAPRKPKERRRSPEELKLAELRRQVVQTAGGGWCQRRRVRREFDEAARTPGGLMAYVLGGGYAVPRKPGRPRKYALA